MILSSGAVISGFSFRDFFTTPVLNRGLNCTMSQSTAWVMTSLNRLNSLLSVDREIVLPPLCQAPDHVGLSVPVLNLMRRLDPDGGHK